MEKTKIITKKEKAKNRHWKNFVDKDYLGSHNLEAGEEMLVTIENFVGEEEVKDTKGGKSNKPVLYFKEDVPKMIMNITNGNTITSLYGSHPDQWIGKKIQIYSTKTKFGKNEVDALRIRDFKPKTDINPNEWKAKLEVATTLEELGSIWKSLPLVIKNDKELIGYKDQLKAQLMQTN